MTEFKVGDLVTWRSQSQGNWKVKVGRVAEVIPALHRPDMTVWPTLMYSGSSRNHVSYVVTVGTTVYWPRTNRLTRAE